MFALIGFFFTHVILVVSTGFFNNMRSMLSGRYRLGHHEGRAREAPSFPCEAAARSLSGCSSITNG